MKKIISEKMSFEIILWQIWCSCATLIFLVLIGIGIGIGIGLGLGWMIILPIGYEHSANHP